MKNIRHLSTTTAKGFTLIELVIVIIILGILSVTAAPKFLSLKSDAQKSVMQGVKAALDVVIKNVYLNSVIQGTDKIYDTAKHGTYTEVSGVKLNTYFGYPQELWQNRLELLMDNSFSFLGNAYQDSALLSQACTEQVCVVEQVKLSALVSGGSGYGLAFLPKGYSIKDQCLVAYYFVASSSETSVTSVHVKVIDAGCAS